MAQGVCINCGGVGTDTKETRARSIGLRREVVCKNCDERFATAEIAIEVLMKLLGAKSEEEASEVVWRAIQRNVRRKQRSKK